VTGETPPPTSAYVDVVDKLGTIAAPLLGGFSLTLLGVVAGTNAGSTMRWPGWAMAALTAATSFLLVTVQFTIVARQFLITPEEQKQRAPEANDETLGRSYAAMIEDYRKWAIRARIAFDLGLTTLLLGLAGVLLPGGDLSKFTTAHWCALVIVAIAFVGEIYWVLQAEWRTAKWNQVISDIRASKPPVN
jgi:hypothetical protein